MDKIVRTSEDIIFIAIIMIVLIGIFAMGILAGKRLSPPPTECSIFTEQKRCTDKGGQFSVWQDYYNRGDVEISCLSKSVDLFQSK